MSNRLLRQHWIVVFAAICVFAAAYPRPIRCVQPSSLPHLRKQGAATQLIVDGNPFLILGGELGNSSSSSLEYMRPVWPKLVALNLNTVLVPVYWELIEPVEGKLDFTLVDGLIQEARKHGLRLAPLWFASWKNSMSCYAPAWVKTNQQRFPRAEDKAGNGLELLSPLSQQNLHTDARDRSAIANKIFNQSAPPELMNYLERRRDALMPELRAVWAATNFKTRGTWEEVFGPGVSTDEIFMAWHFARYANRVAELGKAEYPLPMFVNAALIRPGYQPGQYSSGGPLPHLMDVWRAGAPQIDFLSPDIYFTNFADWCRKYHKSGNPLFIPEAILGPLSAVNALYAIGQHDAIGFSPFSIESVAEPARSLLAGSYDVLTQLAPLILDHQGKNEMAGFLPEGPEQRAPQQARLGGYTLNVTYERPSSPATQGAQTSDAVSGGLAIAVGPDEFIFAGTGLVVTFEANAPGPPLVGILSAQEGKYVEDQWQPGRWLNGDQTHQGRHLRLPPGKFDIQRVKLYRYR